MVQAENVSLGQAQKKREGKSWISHIDIVHLQPETIQLQPLCDLQRHAYL